MSNFKKKIYLNIKYFFSLAAIFVVVPMGVGYKIVRGRINLF